MGGVGRVEGEECRRGVKETEEGRRGVKKQKGAEKNRRGTGVVSTQIFPILPTN